MESEPGTPSHDLRVELRTPLAPEACVRRIMQGVSNRCSGWADGSEALARRPLAGKVTLQRLILHKRSTQRNSFVACFKATMAAEGGGTVIRGTFGLHPRVSMSLFLMSGLVGMVAAVPLFGALWTFLAGEPAKAGVLVLFSFPPLVLAAAGILVGKATYSPATDDALFIVQYLAGLLEEEGRSTESSTGGHAVA